MRAVISFLLTLSSLARGGYLYDEGIHILTPKEAELLALHAELEELLFHESALKKLTLIPVDSRVMEGFAADELGGETDSEDLETDPEDLKTEFFEGGMKMLPDRFPGLTSFRPDGLRSRLMDGATGWTGRPVNSVSPPPPSHPHHLHPHHKPEPDYTQHMHDHLHHHNHWDCDCEAECKDTPAAVAWKHLALKYASALGYPLDVITNDDFNNEKTNVSPTWRTKMHLIRNALISDDVGDKLFDPLSQYGIFSSKHHADDQDQAELTTPGSIWRTWLQSRPWFPQVFRPSEEMEDDLEPGFGSIIGNFGKNFMTRVLTPMRNIQQSMTPPWWANMLLDRLRTTVQGVIRID